MFLTTGGFRVFILTVVALLYVLHIWLYSLAAVTLVSCMHAHTVADLCFRLPSYILVLACSYM
jgi:hypothetical protein